MASYHSRLLLTFVLAAIVCGTSSIGTKHLLGNVHFFAQIDISAYDHLNSTLRPVPASDEILVVEIRDSTAKMFGAKYASDKLDRRVYAQFASLLDKAGARVLLQDIVMRVPKPEEDAVLEKTYGQLERLSVVLTTKDADFEESDTSPDGMGYYFSQIPSASGELPRVRVGHALLFAPGGVATGTIPVRTDLATERPIVATMLLAAVAQRGVDWADIRVSEDRATVNAGPMEWSLAGTEDFFCGWTKSPEDFESLSLEDAFAELRDARFDRFKDRLVILGDARQTSDDPVERTPSLGGLRGYQIVAQITNSFLVPRSLLPTWTTVVFDWVSVTLVGFLAVFSSLLGKRPWNFVVPSGVLALSAIGPQLLSSFFGVLVNQVWPVSVVTLCWMFGLCVSALRHGRLDLRTAGASMERTVLFADMRNSTGLTQQLGHEAFQKLLSEFAVKAERIVRANGGSIERTTGDGFLALFASSTGRTSAYGAVRAAKEIGNLATEVSAKHGIVFKMAFGAESGTVSGTYIVEDGVKRWSSVGDTVNLAARIQSQAAAEEEWLFIGPGAAATLRSEKFVQAVGERPLKGFDEPVQLSKIQFDLV